MHQKDDESNMFLILQRDLPINILSDKFFYLNLKFTKTQRRTQPVEQTCCYLILNFEDCFWLCIVSLLSTFWKLSVNAVILTKKLVPFLGPFFAILCFRIRRCSDLSVCLAYSYSSEPHTVQHTLQNKESNNIDRKLLSFAATYGRIFLSVFYITFVTLTFVTTLDVPDNNIVQRFL